LSKETGYKGVNWIHLALHWKQWQAFVNTVMSLWVPQERGNFLISWATIIFTTKTLLHGVS